METTKYKAELEAELKQLETELKSVGVHNPDVKEDWTERMNDIDTVSADPNDVADRTEEYDTRRAELAVLETRWNNVKSALQKIEDGTYGVCDACGATIEGDRLEANSAATTCKEHMNG